MKLTRTHFLHTLGNWGTFILKVCSSQPFYLIFFFICNLKILTLVSSSFFFVSGARRPHLDRFYVERIQKARLYTDRTFHSLVSLQRLAARGLGLIPFTEALAHEITTRRREFFIFFIFLLYIYIYIFFFF